MKFTGCNTDELWALQESCFTRLAINRSSVHYRHFVNFVSWPVTISCWSWSRMTDRTLFSFGLVCRLNVMYIAMNRNHQFDSTHTGVMLFRITMFPTLFEPYIYIFIVVLPVCRMFLNFVTVYVLWLSTFFLSLILWFFLFKVTFTFSIMQENITRLQFKTVASQLFLGF